ncbi:MAG: TIGR03936 family radical SAM-associated protein [Clostridiales bacterium]|jgi:radical SAM-linked protein|nr:TIGR03936 family radical SAM-associated protein [Clostridiales bacterium]
MSLKQSYYRYRITFAKAGMARFIGHLDLQSLFQKAIKRAKLPVAYSEGFNPHQLLSFAAPLPLGMAGYAEILEVFMAHEVTADRLFAALDAQLPQGIAIVGIMEVPSVGKSAAAIIRMATYSITFSQALDLHTIIPNVLSSQSIEVEIKSKKGVKTADIRPDIHDICIETPRSLWAVLACGSERNLKPEILAQHILKVSGIAPEDCDISYERLAIGQDVPPL